MVGFSPHLGKQREFLQSNADWVFYGGARGGGKSLMLAWKAALTPRKWSYHYLRKEISKSEYEKLKKEGKQVEFKVQKISIDYPDYIALLIRRTYPQLERNLKPECAKLYNLYGASWQERNKCYVFPSGAKVYLVHCQDRRALDNYIGGNYNFIGIDEANQFPETWVDELSTSVRTSNPDLKPQICLTSNPGNIGHVWLKRRFVDRCEPINDGKPVYSETFDVTYQPKKTAPVFTDEEKITFTFIPATVFDNPSLCDNDPGYVRKLKKLNPILRAMWLEGKWDVFAGTFFDNWNIMHHVIPDDTFVYKKHFNKKTHTLYRFYDYGTKAPFVCLFAALDRDGYLTIFDEISETGLSASKQVVFVNEYTYKKYKLLPEDFDDDIADPAYWAKTSEKDGMLYSPNMFYGDGGIFLSKGNNDRKVGAKVVYDAFDIPENGKPRVRFKESCLYSIETIPNLPGAENDPEDIDTKSEDHSYDALRYGCTKVLPSQVEDKKEQKGWRYKQLKDKNSQNWKIA
tara:strand:- start:1204 stop:2748 length:1545 start_codon:yes stop_codon:yes gene_type:complete